VSRAGASPDFAACRERLERALSASCEQRDSWAGTATAGVYAALEFAAADPAAALLLTDRATVRWKEREPAFAAMVEHLAGLLKRGAPPANPRLPSAEVVVVHIARQVNLRLSAGGAGELMEIAPDMAFLALMPFVGFAEARRCAQPTATA